MTQPTEEYDVIVIGGGPVGENAAARVVSHGLSAVLVESERLGGECSYWACMPSKALLRSGQAVAAARRVAGAREAVTGDLSIEAVLARRDSFAAHWDDSGQVEWASSAGVDVVRGRGRLAGAKVVEVDTPDGTRRLHARAAVVVCVGSVPKPPPIPGLAEVPYWGSREATSAQRVPRSLAVLGAGVVGVELAQAWARLGSRVSLLDTASRPLSTMEEVAGDLVAEGVRADGVELHMAATVSSVSTVNGGIRLELAGDADVEAEQLLVATGRRPATDDLGVQSVGLVPGEPLVVDRHGQVRGVEDGWLHAAGDVTDQPQLTHQGKYAARVVGDVIATRHSGISVVDSPDWSAYTTTANQHAVPAVVFTDPEVASVGPTAAEAERAGHRTRVVELDLAVAGSALQADDYQGRVRMIVDADRDVLLGMTFVGQDVAELVHAATIAVVGEVPLDRLWHAVPVFPTMNEIWLRLLEQDGH